MKKTFAAFLLLLATCRLASQTEAIVTMLTVNDGLSQGMIFDIIQSRDGFIWIATKDGLNRYDGSRFEVFSPDPFNPFAIGGSEVQALFEDSRGWIWINLPENLDVFDPNSGRFFHLMHEGKPLGHAHGVRFMETPDGAIWLADNDRIWKTSPPKDMLAKAAKQGKSQIELPFKAISMSAVSGWSGGPMLARDLLFTKEKKLLIRTNHGLFRLDPATEQIVLELPIPDYDIEWLAESKSGEILMKGRQAGNNFLTLLSNGKVFYKKDNQPDYYLSIFVFDDAGYFWAYNNINKIIKKWQPSVFFNNGEPEMEIPASVLQLENNDGYSSTYFMVDKSGIVWVGTNGFGVLKINEKGQKFKTALPGTSHRLLFEDPSGALFTAEIPDKKFLSKSFDRSVPMAVGSQQRATDDLLPTSELPTGELNLEDAFLQKSRSIVEANLADSDFEMPQLERALAMSRSQIFRKVKALTGKSPSLFIRSIRLHHGRHLLQTTTLSVSGIAYQVGYSALNNFSDAFMEEFGERPMKVRG